MPQNPQLSEFKNFGVPGVLLSRFCSYLSGRFQRVALEGVLSDWFPVTAGFTQGSMLGPLLFLAYVNDARLTISIQTPQANYSLKELGGGANNLLSEPKRL